MTENKKSYDRIQNKIEEPAIPYESAFTSLELIIEVFGGIRVLGKKIKNTLDFLNLNIPISALKVLQQKMNFTNREIGETLDMSESTLQRRIKKNQSLDKKESENAVHVASVWARGIEVFSDEQDFRTWLNTKNIALGNNMPRTLLSSPIGREELKNLLTQIEWGIYS